MSDDSGDRGLLNSGMPLLGVRSFSPVLNFKPASFSMSLPPPGDLGLAGPLLREPMDGSVSERLSPAGRALTPNVCSIHSFSVTAISRPIPSTLFRDSASISFCRTCNLFFAHIVCKTPFLPAARADAPSSGGNSAGRGLVYHTIDCLVLSCGLSVSDTLVGTGTPGGCRKYMRCMSFAGASLAGSTRVDPSKDISQSPLMPLVVSSSSHSTMMITVAVVAFACPASYS